jgi:hypothetical protein
MRKCLLSLLIVCSTIGHLVSQNRVFEMPIELDPFDGRSQVLKDEGTNESVLVIWDRKTISFILLDDSLRLSKKATFLMPLYNKNDGFLGFSKIDDEYYFTYIRSNRRELQNFRVNFETNGLKREILRVNLSRDYTLTFYYTWNGRFHLWFTNSKQQCFHLETIYGNTLSNSIFRMSEQETYIESCLGVSNLPWTFIMRKFFRGTKKIMQYGLLAYNENTSPLGLCMASKFYIDEQPMFTIETDSATIFLEFDLENISVNTKTFTYGYPGRYRNSFLFDAKIFQSVGDKQGMMIKIYDMITSDLLKDYVVNVDSIEKNTPVMKINTAYGIRNRELTDPTLFFDHFGRFNSKLAVAVEKLGEEFLITYAISFENIIEPFVPIPVGGYLFIIHFEKMASMVDNVCYYRSVVDCNFNHVPDVAVPPLKIYSTAQDITQKIGGSGNTSQLFATTIFRSNGRKYFGYYLESGIIKKYYVDGLNE